MNTLSKLQPLFIVLSAVVGVVIGQLAIIGEYAGNLIEPFLIVMLFFVFLCVDLKEITRSFTDLQFSTSALAINFIITPILSLVLAKSFFAGQTDLQIGIIMLMVTPCTDWYLVFTRLSGGNVSLGSSILPLNLILQILLLPIYLLIFIGAEVSINPSIIFASIFFVLFVPLIAANLVKFVFVKTRRDIVLDRISSKSDDYQFILLCLAIISMFASQGSLLVSNLFIFIRLLPPLVLFFALIFFIALLAGRCLRFPVSNTASLIFTVSARNSPVSLAIATITFPYRPLISLVLVIGPLIELPILALESLIVKNVVIKKE